MPQHHLNQRIALLDVEEDIELDVRLPYNRYIVTGELLNPTYDKRFILVPKGLTNEEKLSLRNTVVEIVWMAIFGQKLGTRRLYILGNDLGVSQDSGVFYFFYNYTTDTWEYIITCGCSHGSGTGSGIY